MARVVPLPSTGDSGVNGLTSGFRQRDSPLLKTSTHRPGGYAELLVIALPMMMSSGTQSIMHVIDRIFVTWLSPDALAAALPAQGSALAVGVRPTDIDVFGPQEGGLPGRVRLREFRGDDVLMTFDAAGTRLRAIVHRDTPHQPGDPVTLVPRADRLHLFSADSGDAIGHTEDGPGGSRGRSTFLSPAH